jgi:ABC-type multidrug transport system fused ATPase/permease subunit
MAKKKVDIQLTEAQSAGDAMNYIFIGLKYFLMNHTKITLVVIFGVFIGLSMFFRDYFTTDRIKIMDEKIQPIVSQPISLLNNPFMLYAQEKGDKMIEFDSVSKSFWTGTQRKVILDRVSFRVELGNSLGILAPNGTGKTVRVAVS